MIALVMALAAATAIAFPVTTADTTAQTLVERGMLYYYAYDQGDAGDAFAAAAARDPNLAMAYWGEALADGPDLNTAMTPERFEHGRAAMQQALSVEHDATARERRFIDAMALRYRGTWDDWNGDDAAYRAAMSALASSRSGDTGGNTATLLAAEALLEHGGLTWTGSAPTTADARLSLQYVQRVLASEPSNVMANHLCLHIYDLAPNRTPAWPCAQRLDSANLPPQAEHLAHMPAHYWIETGEYAAAAASSERAFSLFTQLQGLPGHNPEHDRYLEHDVYVGYSAAMMLHDYGAARMWCTRMDSAYGTPYDALTALRFGRFTDAYTLAQTSAPNDLAVRGLAALNLNDIAGAETIAARLRAITTYGDLVQIFFASLAARQGHTGEAAHWIDRAIETQRNSFAAESIPLLPALEVRGTLALQRSAYGEAAAAYRAALTAYPNDPRALDGLATAQRARAASP